MSIEEVKNHVLRGGKHDLSFAVSQMFYFLKQYSFFDADEVERIFWDRILKLLDEKK